uniref:Uncharacterized protein n=1 Tax=Tanacetum cinerariifolium TaxID=118510 RepID=A0A6L2M339_TANCI|nr:hypothetical protein [Tanacetum cinerariifolium]
MNNTSCDKFLREYGTPYSQCFSQHYNKKTVSNEATECKERNYFIVVHLPPTKSQIIIPFQDSSRHTVICPSSTEVDRFSLRSWGYKFPFPSEATECKERNYFIVVHLPPTKSQIIIPFQDSSRHTVICPSSTEVRLIGACRCTTAIAPPSIAPPLQAFDEKPMQDMASMHSKNDDLSLESTRCIVAALVGFEETRSTAVSIQVGQVMFKK